MTGLEDAACARLPIEAVDEFFFSDGRRDINPVAAKVCRACPAKAACLEIGEATPGAQGVFGGKMFHFAARAALIDATPSRRKLVALIDAGWTRAELERRAHVEAFAFRDIVNGRRTRIHPRLAKDVAKLRAALPNAARKVFTSA